MSPTLLFILFTVVSLSVSFVACTEVLFSAEATTVEVGKSLKLRCELKNFDPENEAYAVYFEQEIYPLWYYSISAPDSTGKRTTTFTKISYLDSIGRQNLSSTFPVYEITITPTVANANEYWCKLYLFRADNVNSNRLSITVTPPPTAVLTSNVTTIVPSQPLTLTCTFARFNPLPVNYLVTFGSLRDGQLGAFEVANGKALLSVVIHSQVEVFTGRRAIFPTFDLVLTEKVDNSSIYWCALEETGKAPVLSESWPAFVHFNSSKSSETQRLGTCAIGATTLNLSGKTYSVQFFTDLGTQSVNLLAEFIFTPNLTEVFKSNPLTPWNSIGHGPNVSWPTFSILANGASLHGTWWCALAFGAQGAPDYREFKSNTADL